MTANQYQETHEAKIGADRMEAGLPCIPDAIAGDLQVVLRLNEHVAKLQRAVFNLEAKLEGKDSVTRSVRAECRDELVNLAWRCHMMSVNPRLKRMLILEIPELVNMLRRKN